MTDTDVHSCGYYCDRFLCIKAQRDELREKLFAKEWVGLTEEEMDYIEGITLDRQDAIRMAAVALQEKNSG